MGLLSKFLGKKDQPKLEEAVLIYLDGTGLPDQIYQEYDLSTLEDQLIDAIGAEHAGEFDGNEIGPDGATLFAYGQDADHLFSVIEPVLRDYPLCQNARVVIRKGGPGATQTEVRI